MTIIGDSLTRVGTGISQVGSEAQKELDSGLKKATKEADHAVDDFERSALGDNPLGHLLGESARTLTHFGSGLVSGVAGVATGLVGLAGKGVRYVSDDAYRAETNHDVGYVVTHPLEIAGRLADAGVKSFKEDPARFVGSLTGAVAVGVVTGSAAARLSTVGEGTVAAEGLAEASSGTRVLGQAGKVLQVPKTPGDLAAGWVGNNVERAVGGGDAGRIIGKVAEAGTGRTVDGSLGQVHPQPG